ncbi:hypothetical protein RhiirA1_499142, partial [Rhizophagus irregularis]
PQYTPPDSDNEEDGYDKMVGVSSGVNDATINALGWKADKPLDFTIKDNSKHITESLRWFTDVPVSINLYFRFGGRKTGHRKGIQWHYELQISTMKVRMWTFVELVEVDVCLELWINNHNNIAQQYPKTETI